MVSRFHSKPLRTYRSGLVPLRALLRPLLCSLSSSPTLSLLSAAGRYSAARCSTTVRHYFAVPLFIRLRLLLCCSLSFFASFFLSLRFVWEGEGAVFALLRLLPAPVLYRALAVLVRGLVSVFSFLLPLRPHPLFVSSSVGGQENPLGNLDLSLRRYDPVREPEGYFSATFLRFSTTCSTTGVASLKSAVFGRAVPRFVSRGENSLGEESYGSGADLTVLDVKRDLRSRFS